jgi:hypothetical protein
MAVDPQTPLQRNDTSTCFDTRHLPARAGPVDVLGVESHISEHNTCSRIADFPAVLWQSPHNRFIEIPLPDDHFPLNLRLA